MLARLDISSVLPTLLNLTRDLKICEQMYWPYENKRLKNPYIEFFSRMFSIEKLGEATKGGIGYIPTHLVTSGMTAGWQCQTQS